MRWFHIAERMFYLLVALAVLICAVAFLVALSTRSESLELVLPSAVDGKPSMGPRPKVRTKVKPVQTKPPKTPMKTPKAITVNPDSVWDRLAQCESGGNWSANTGNGYHGGLQFLNSTWRAAGGTRYAPMACQATREQQITIAKGWLARTSWSQWPACSRRLGLR